MSALVHLGDDSGLFTAGELGLFPGLWWLPRNGKILHTWHGRWEQLAAPDGGIIKSYS